ncbi:TonB-dependent receptor [Rheinheimera aquimaris]|uniref:TonB-dependent receptor n=1 Tax=Rheinheimera aquimaris TaxID=412437 RepID=A0ABN1DLI6_9GAMM|nr:TonB-dependent receptor [Rheinheimera aquimaris]MCB5213121.1 TonB-dependent receptor [Rheinheimera aquimaris]
MNKFKLSMLTLAIAAGTGSNAIAQTAEQATADEQIEVIAVTGYRGSLQKAQAIKMSENSIVEVLSAEDIGKLPDTSVAESLARLPGLAGERRNGRTSGLSVRGFNENYVGTSLNGRELLGMGDNRGVEYDLYPSEIVSTAIVYKTPEASLMAQGIGGTVDLQTIKPLAAERTLAFNGSYEKNDQDSGNPDFDNTGHRLSFNYVDKFLDDRLGVALVVASLETPRQEQQFRGWGYAGANPDRAADGVTVPDGTVILGGHDSFTRSAMLERDSIALVLEYIVNDRLKATFDALYIDFNEQDARRGLEEGGAEWGTGAYTITGVDNGLVTSGYYDGFYSVVRNDVREQDADLKTFGLNLEYQINDNWSGQLDVSTGKVTKTITDIESYSGVGRANTPNRPITARSWVMTSNGAFYSDHPTIAPVDLTDPSLIRLAGPQAWGGSLNPVTDFQNVPGFGPDTAQDGFVNNPDFEETLDSVRLQANGYVEWGIFNELELGVVHKKRSKTKINNGAFLTANDWPDASPIPNVLGVADLSFIGINGVLAYDSLGLYRSGFYTSTDAALLENGRYGDTYSIDEKLTTLYGMLDISTEIGDIAVTGNVGVQIVRADQQGDGFSATTNAQGFTQAVPVSAGTDYTDVLPSLNLSFEVADRQYVRTSLSKVMSRPRMDDMRPNSQVTFAFNDNNILDDDPLNSAWGGNGGNTELKPLEADQFDLSYENYFHDNGFFAASFFFKDLKNWHRNITLINDFSSNYIPGFHQSSDATGNLPPATFLGRLDIRQDGLQGFVRGYEFQASIPFDIIHEALDGFGIVASATFMDGKLDDGGRVPGLSEEIYTLTAYYEYKGFEFRISGTKRDEFQTEERGLSLALTPVTRLGNELWDAQIGYDFSESGIEALDGLRVTLQAQNLTDEKDVTTNGADNRQIVTYQSYGRNYMLGLNYKF